jgi:hypothetical protein
MFNTPPTHFGGVNFNPYSSSQAQQDLHERQKIYLLSDQVSMHIV